MKRCICECWILLCLLEVVTRFQSFQTLLNMVRDYPINTGKISRASSVEELCHAMDLACVLYFKKVLCLQRSSATVILLRRHGWQAEMVTGVQILPFESHAWVEIAGAIVNDKPYMHEIYQVLEHR